MKQKPHFSIIALFLILAWLVGCGLQPLPQPGTLVDQPQEVATPKEEAMPVNSTTPGPANTGLDHLANQAKEDLAQRLNIDIKEIQVLEVREVVWPDASLGCPQPGRTYNQVPQDGLLIRLRVEGQMYFYHSGETEEPFLCEDTSLVVPKVTPKYDEFVPPPDSEID